MKLTKIIALSLFASIAIVEAASPFLPFAQEAVAYWLIKHQKSEKYYELNRTLLRQEAAGMALVMAWVTYPPDYECRNLFADINYHSPNYWACRIVENAVDKQLISTENPKFFPGRPATRAEVLAMFMKGAGIKNIKDINKYSFDADTTDWEKYVIATAKYNGIISTTNPFRPHENIKRGEAFVMGVNIMKIIWKSK